MTRTVSFLRGAVAFSALACVTLLAGINPAGAQTQKPITGLAAGQSALTATPDVHFDQKVNTSVPIDLPFHDETGKIVMLRDYITGKQPVLLMMPFFKCAGGCTTEQQGLMTALNDVKYTPGADFQVVIVSINPKEAPAMALAKKTEYTSVLKRKESIAGIHYLTTDKNEDIRKLADTIGFHYVANLATEQFGHPTGFVILTPQGKTSRYFYGSDYNPRDVKLALTEAGENKIGSVVDQILILCYHYDATTGKYGFLIMRVTQVLGTATVLILALSIGLMLRAEKKQHPVDGIRNTVDSRPNIEDGSGSAAI